MKTRKTKIFLDSGNVKDTRDVLWFLERLDGQTTNPSLIAENSKVQAHLKRGDKFSQKELGEFYEKVIGNVAELISGGAVSIEVYADLNTDAEAMVKQARVMYKWCENSYIKLPITKAGLEAAEVLSREGVRLNMTLCFTQSQAAAVYAATKEALPGRVFVSPFIGRLDDVGLNGIDLIRNILKMYERGDGHVEVLAASLRSVDHLLACFEVEVDIVTAPIEVLRKWVLSGGEKKSVVDYVYDKGDKLSIDYAEIDLEDDWRKYDIDHELTRKGLNKFYSDWSGLIDFDL